METGFRWWLSYRLHVLGNCSVTFWVSIWRDRFLPSDGHTIGNLLCNVWCQKSDFMSRLIQARRSPLPESTLELYFHRDRKLPVSVEIQLTTARFRKCFATLVLSNLTGCPKLWSLFIGSSHLCFPKWFLCIFDNTCQAIPHTISLTLTPFKTSWATPGSLS